MKRRTILISMVFAFVAGNIANAAIDDDLLLLSPSFTETGGYGYWQDVSENGYHSSVVGVPPAYDGTSDLGGTYRDTAIDVTSMITDPGSDMHIIAGGDDTFNPGLDDYSISFWYNQTDSLGWQHVIAMGSDGSGTPGYSLHMYNGAPSIRMDSAVEITADDRLSVGSGMGDISSGGWHHVAAIFDRATAGSVSLYVDGNLKNSAILDPAYDVTAPSGYDLLISGRWNSAANNFIGYLDDIAMYQGALSSSDVATLYGTATLDANTITTPGISPVMIQNFETIRENPYSLEATTDVTGTIQATPIGYLTSMANDAQRGEVLNFTGTTGDHITFDDPSETVDLNPGIGSYTVSLWYNVSSDAENNVQILAAKGNQGSGSPGWNLHLIGDTLNVRATGNDGNIYVASTPATADEWHHVAMVIDNENGLLKAYLDGQSSEATESIWTPGVVGMSFVAGAGTEFTTVDPVVVGARVSGAYSDYGFDGTLNDFAIWDRALSETEILAIYGGASIISENIAGDANGDGKVDGSDVTILAGNWQKGVSDGMVATWEEGDFNDDGKVDGSDVTILAGNWQYGVEAAAASVPEPSVLLLLLSGIGSLFLVRRR